MLQMKEFGEAAGEGFEPSLTDPAVKIVEEYRAPDPHLSGTHLSGSRLRAFAAPLEPIKLPPHLLTPPLGFIPVYDRFKGVR